MKPAIFILIIVSSILIDIHNCQKVLKEICEWQTKLDSLVSQLTPNGQTLAKEIMLGFQRISTAGMQSVYNDISKEYDYEIQLLNNSLDASKLIQIEKMYGIGDMNAGNGPLLDMCEEAKQIAFVLYSFDQKNIPYIIKVLKEADKRFKKISPILISITGYLTSPLQAKLIATENLTVLTNIADLYQERKYWK